MSRSPRKNIRMAADELDDLLEVIERHPEQRAELAAAIGEDLLREVLAARETLRRAASRVDDPGRNDPMTRG